MEFKLFPTVSCWFLYRTYCRETQLPQFQNAAVRLKISNEDPVTEGIRKLGEYPAEEPDPAAQLSKQKHHLFASPTALRLFLFSPTAPLHTTPLYTIPASAILIYDVTSDT